MGLINRMKEGLYRLRIVPKPGLDSSLNTTKESDTVLNQIEKAQQNGQIVDYSDFGKLENIKLTRDNKYSAYEEMILDGRIGAAVEMYANDAVQYNAEGKIIWVESDEEDGKTDVTAYVEKLLKDLHIAENIWSYAYCLCLYGDVYIELFANTSTTGNKPTLLVEPSKTNMDILLQQKIDGSKIERYIEKVPNPAEMYDLQYKGKTSGFVRSRDNLKDTSQIGLGYSAVYNNANHDVTLFTPQKFVHLCLSPNIDRFPEKFNLIKKTEILDVLKDGLVDASELEGSGGELSFNVKLGQSILENVYNPYQSLKLKEDSVALERLTRASITRIIQVELGDMPEQQKKVKLQEIKQQIEQQLIMNKDLGYLQSTPGAQPTENIIYTTTKNGKGTISTVNIGGDVNIGDLTDIDKAEDKVYGALLIPKALLGSDMEGSGLSNGGSLTEMNTTYARRIKRIQNALTNGITDLVNIFALAEGVGEKIIGKFKIKLTPIITVEDTRRDELLSTKIRNVSEIMNLFSGMDEKLDEDTKIQMLTNWLSNYLNQQDIVDIIDSTLKETEKEEQESDSDDKSNESFEDEDIDINIDTFGDSSLPDTDFEMSNSIPQKSPSENLETAENIDTSEIEGEDLL